MFRRFLEAASELLSAIARGSNSISHAEKES
jgi:hypothetical protein